MRTSLRLAIALGLGLSSFAAGPAQNGRDGLWSVRLVTEAGSCDASYSATVAIENGSVRPLSGADGATVSGQVAPNGAVNLDIRKSIAQAAASGRLSEKSGSGTWSLAMLGCQGRWTASKRVQTASN
jgi:hypothetical protein